MVRLLIPNVFSTTKTAALAMTPLLFWYLSKLLRLKNNWNFLEIVINKKQHCQD